MQITEISSFYQKIFTDSEIKKLAVNNDVIIVQFEMDITATVYFKISGRSEYCSSFEEAMKEYFY